MGIQLKPSPNLTARDRIAIKKGGHAQPRARPIRRWLTPLDTSPPDKIPLCYALPLAESQLICHAYI